MLSDLDETIRSLLVREGPTDPAEVDISFEIPNREWSARIAKPTLNCYLFDIRENRELRQTGMQVGPSSSGPTRRPPPLRLDVAYLLTAWTRMVEDEHRLLWHAYRTLMRFGTLPESLLQGELRGRDAPVQTKLAQEGVLRSPGEFWTALDNQLKPSLSFVATLSVEQVPVAAGPLVLTSTTRVHQRGR